MKRARNTYPTIDRFLGDWLEQLATIREQDEYAVILSELDSPDDSEYGNCLRLLDEHLTAAPDACSNFSEVIREKARLPKHLHQANVTVLNKLSEVRAVVGLSKLGFDHIRFSGTPDLMATKNGKVACIEVTRLGRSSGRRSQVWDRESGAPNLESLVDVGYRVGMMSSGGKVVDAISEAIYREIEDKYPQVRDLQDAALRVIWISLGRDYLTCNLYELEGMGGSFTHMPRTAAKAVALAVQAHCESGLCQLLTHVALCPGRELEDLMVDARA